MTSPSRPAYSPCSYLTAEDLDRYLKIQHQSSESLATILEVDEENLTTISENDGTGELQRSPALIDIHLILKKA